MTETPGQPYFYLLIPCAFRTLLSKNPVFNSLRPLFQSGSHCNRFIVFNHYKIHQRYSQCLLGSLNNPQNEFQAIKMNFSCASPTSITSVKFTDVTRNSFRELSRDAKRHCECFVERQTIGSFKTRFIISSESVLLLSLLQFQCFPRKEKIRL